MTVAERLGRFGIWRSASLVTPELAVGIERFGFGALWLGGSPSGGLVQVAGLLDATTPLMLGTSIVNIWKDEARDVASAFARGQERPRGRVGVGGGAGPREATQGDAPPHEALR